MKYSMKENGIPKKIPDVKVEGKHPKGRPKLRWEQEIMKDVT
jgi:hypothetical protein